MCFNCVFYYTYRHIWYVLIQVLCLSDSLNDIIIIIIIIIIIFSYSYCLARVRALMDTRLLLLMVAYRSVPVPLNQVQPNESILLLH